MEMVGVKPLDYTVEVERDGDTFYLWISHCDDRWIFHDEKSKFRAEGVRRFVLDNENVAAVILLRVSR